MSKVTADISMSLDGFVTEPEPGGENPLGDDPGRLHDWMFDEKTPTDAEMVDEIYARAGAVLIGKRMSTSASSRGVTSALRDARLRADARVT